ncbi:hypothetical protein HYS72_00295 [Candidatus Pacearchaeota archaeon]|nr:hypothetical protein [Candidatus Pacearchaeota archaeon]
MTTSINSNKKPVLDLKPLEKTAVNASTQKEYNVLRMVYEIGGWKWDSALFPNQNQIWNVHGKNTCIEGGISLRKNKSGEFGHSSKHYYLRENWKIISPETFYKRQGIETEQIETITKYFDGRNNLKVIP